MGKPCDRKGWALAAEGEHKCCLYHLLAVTSDKSLSLSLKRLTLFPKIFGMKIAKTSNVIRMMPGTPEAPQN